MEQLRHQKKLLGDNKESLKEESGQFRDRKNFLKDLLENNESGFPLETGRDLELYANKYSTKSESILVEVRSIQNFAIQYPLSQAAKMGMGTEVVPGIPDTPVSALYEPIEKYLQSVDEEKRKQLAILFQSKDTPNIFKAYLHLLVYKHNRDNRQKQRACFTTEDIPDLKGRLSKEHTVCETL